MKFANPSMLWALLLLIPLAICFLLTLRKKQKNLETLADSGAHRFLIPQYNPKRVRSKTHLYLITTALFIIALARPQWGFHWEQIHRKGLDIMVVLDTSNSMLAQDIKPNRLDRAKLGLQDLANRLSTDRIGLIAFAGSSFLQCPLTIDYAAFLMTLDDLYAGIIPRGGTQIGQALKTAADSFDPKTGGDKVILLITDGEAHKDEAENIIKELKDKNIKVFCVGVGTQDGELIPVPDAQGGLSFLKDREGRVVKTSLDEQFIQQIAVDTGGSYVRSLAGDFGLERIYEQGISLLQRADEESRMVKKYGERFHYPLLAGALLLLLESLLSIKNKVRNSEE